MSLKKVKTTSRRNILYIALLLVLSQALLPFLMPKASAGTLAQGLVRFDRMQTSQFTSGLVCAKTNAAVQTEAAVGVNFPTGYTVSTTVGNWTVSTGTTTGWPATAIAWPGVGTPSAGQAVGQTVVFPSSDLAINTLYCFNWTNNTTALQTKSSATNDNTGVITTCNANTTACAGLSTSTANLDTISYATATVSNDTIAVTASINPSFQMSFSGGNTDALGTLTTGAVASSSTTTMTVNTNAKNGWMAWVKDASPAGLNSTSAGYTITPTGVGSASQALVAGTEGYNTGITYSQTSGTCTAGSAVNANFDKAGGSNKGGGIDTTLRTILTCGGTTNAGVITPTVFAAINGSTPAANDYSDSETYVAGGIF